MHSCGPGEGGGRVQPYGKGAFGDEVCRMNANQKESQDATTTFLADQAHEATRLPEGCGHEN